MSPFGIGGSSDVAVRPHVQVGGSGLPGGVPGLAGELSGEAEARLLRTVVDTHLHLPDMFELTFDDQSGTVIGDAKLSIGTEVTIYGGAPSSNDAPALISGEVTAIEGIYEDLHYRTVVRGYEKSHRLQRAQRTRTFVDMTDSDIAAQIAAEAGIETGDIDETSVSHPHLAQVAQTDWAFLSSRALEIGYETGVSGGKLFFRRASGRPPGGGLLGAIGGAIADAAGAGPAKLTYKDNLIAFYPRLSSAALTPEVEVRMWDPVDAKVVVGRSDMRSHTADVHDGAGDLASSFGRGGLLGMVPSVPSMPVPIPGLPDFGRPPSTKARLSVDRPVGRGGGVSGAVDEAADALAEHMASTFAEAEGYAVGDPKIQAGKKVQIDQVPQEFAGAWIVTNSRHVFDLEEGGYRTRFFVSGRHERSLLGLAANAQTTRRSTIDGLVTAVVTNNNDPEGLHRVKLAFPWLAPDFESDWARLAHLGMGDGWGAVFLPEVGDEVLVGFEHGDVRRPYVVGSLSNGDNKVDLGGDAVHAIGPLAEVVKRGFVSRLGHRLVFDDDRLGMRSGITLSDADGKVAIVLDKAMGSITITCDSQAPPAEITIEQKGVGGSISITSAGDVSVEAAAPGSLSLKGGTGVTIESDGPVSVKGNPIRLN